MAKEKAPLPMPMATARELARVEAQRWQQVVDVLTLAASYEDEAGTIERKLAALRETRGQAEADHLEALGKLATEREAAQAIADAAIAATHEQIAAVHAEFTASMALGREQIAAVQAELIAIGRDQDAARQAAAEYAGLRAEVHALRLERDALVEKLTR